MNYNAFAGPLQGLGQGLMAAGSGGWQNFAPGFSQGLMQAQNLQLDKLDREERRRLRELQERQLQMQLDQQLTANQDEVAQRQAWEKYLGQGMMSPNGMSQAQFGGAPQNQMAPGLMNFTPDQLSFLKTLPPEQGMSIVGQKMFAEAPGAPETTGGFYWDQEKGQFLPIPGYEDQQKSIRAAGRAVANVNNNMGSTGIDYGDPETGLAWRRNPDGSVMLDDNGLPMAAPYQGSKAYVTAEEKETKGENAETQKQRAADIVLEDINRTLEGVAASPMLTTGIGAQITSGIGGTPAKDVSELVTTIRGNIGFDRLQQMRDASPTGGALGQVSDFENRNLQAVLGSLEQSQSPEQFVQNLLRLEEVYLDIVHGPGNRPEGWQRRDAATILGGQKGRLKFNPATGELE